MNRLFDFKANARISRMLEPTKPEVDLADVKVGKNFQFSGDKYGVRHVVDVEGEFILIQTLGHSNESGDYYITHYSHLRKNQSPVWDDDNNLRKNG